MAVKKLIRKIEWSMARPWITDNSLLERYDALAEQGGFECLGMYVGDELDGVLLWQAIGNKAFVLEYQGKPSKTDLTMQMFGLFMMMMREKGFQSVACQTRRKGLIRKLSKMADFKPVYMECSL